MSFAKINGLTVHYRLRGNPAGSKLVFLNSLGTGLAIWDELIEQLGPGFRTLAYDKRGHGLSDIGTSPYQLQDHVADLLGLLDHLNWGKVTLVGLSVGGMIAPQMAIQHPERVEAMVLCDTAAKIGSDESWAARITAVEQGGLEAIADAVMKRWFSPTFRRDHATDVAGWRNMLIRIPASGYIGTCAALRDADLTRAVGGIRVPVLCLAGEDDLSTPPDLVRGTAKLIPGARFQLIPGAGHLPPIEQPQILAGLLLSFFKEIGLA